MYETREEAEAASTAEDAEEHPVIYLLPKSFTGSAHSILHPTRQPWDTSYFFKDAADRAYLYAILNFDETKDEITAAPNPYTRSVPGPIPMLRPIYPLPASCLIPENSMVYVVGSSFAVIYASDESHALYAKVMRLKRSTKLMDRSGNASSGDVWREVKGGDGARLAWVGDLSADSLTVDIWRGSIYFNTQTRAFGGELRVLDFVDAL